MLQFFRIFSIASECSLQCSVLFPDSFLVSVFVGAAAAATTLVTVPKKKAFKVCATCGKSRKKDRVMLFTCSTCMKVFYCSPECQKSDWKKHKPTHPPKRK